ncbi:hypothetical protein IFR09_20910 [Pseudomonas syringae]|nr:hypothetical protein [Pseudomonas syringae]MBD8577291.1 hypothetical protein [Pseudomonas syringae]MBD8793115.1 hypothetical protein [Pseudomonas syringae]MBD8802912.1 hypothetical protein [Pseudomonas syringae]MBD8813624.1 hypothetical protein [Pseudomonas syringae]
MNRVIKQLVIGACPFLLFGQATQAMADQCPEVSDFAQKGRETTMEFRAVLLYLEGQIVFCEYTKGPYQSLLQIQSTTPIAAEGKYWGDQDDPLPLCSESLEKCTFTLQSNE